MGRVVLRFDVTTSKLESMSGDGEKFTVGHWVVPFIGLGFLSRVEDELYLVEGLNSN
jgi:hypothetical protein